VALLRLNDKAGAGQVIRAWQDRSARIGALLKRKQSQRDVSVAAVAADEPPTAAPAVDRTADMSTGSVAAAAGDDAGDAGAGDVGYPAGQASGRHGTDDGAASSRAASCQASIPVQSLSPERALARGWCLMDRNRPVEAAAAFAVAAQSPLPRTRADAAYGETLADLRAEVTDRAAVSAAQAPQSEKRSVEMTIALLAQEATAACTDGRNAETIILLNERARYAPETNDLLVLKGFAYLKLGQLGDARRIFTAVAATGFHDGLKGLAAVEALEHPH
jgi:hypothetical protein